MGQFIIWLCRSDMLAEFREIPLDEVKSTHFGNKCNAATRKAAHAIVFREGKEARYLKRTNPELPIHISPIPKHLKPKQKE